MAIEVNYNLLSGLLLKKTCSFISAIPLNLSLKIHPLILNLPCLNNSRHFNFFFFFFLPYLPTK